MANGRLSLLWLSVAVLTTVLVGLMAFVVVGFGIGQYLEHYCTTQEMTAEESKDDHRGDDADRGPVIGDGSERVRGSVSARLAGFTTIECNYTPGGRITYNDSFPLWYSGGVLAVAGAIVVVPWMGVVHSWARRAA